MADQKITNIPTLGVAPANNDKILIVDIDDFTDGAGGTNKLVTTNLAYGDRVTAIETANTTTATTISTMQSDITGKAPTVHTHPQSDIANLTTDLTAITNNITAVQLKTDFITVSQNVNLDTMESAIDVNTAGILTKADLTHNHAIANVTNLQTNLNTLQNNIDVKIDSSHVHITPANLGVTPPTVPTASIVQTYVNTQGVTLKNKKLRYTGSVSAIDPVLNIFEVDNLGTNGTVFDCTPTTVAGGAQTLGVGYLRLTADLVFASPPAVNSQILGVWQPEAGFVNTISQVTGNECGFRLLAGKTYELEAYLYVSGLADTEFMFLNWRNKTALSTPLPATVMGGTNYVNGASREVGPAVVKAIITPATNMDVVLVYHNGGGSFTIKSETENNSNGIYCKEIPTAIPANLPTIASLPTNIVPTNTTAFALDYTATKSIYVDVTTAQTGNITLLAPILIGLAVGTEVKVIFSNTSATARTFTFPATYQDSDFQSGTVNTNAISAMSIVATTGFKSIDFVVSNATTLKRVSSSQNNTNSLNQTGVNIVQNIRQTANAQNFNNIANPTLTPVTITNKHTFTIPPLASVPLWLVNNVGNIAIQTTPVAGDEVTIDIINNDLTNNRIVTFAGGYKNHNQSGFTVNIPAGVTSSYKFSVKSTTELILINAVERDLILTQTVTTGVLNGVTFSISLGNPSTLTHSSPATGGSIATLQWSLAPGGGATAWQTGTPGGGSAVDGQMRQQIRDYSTGNYTTGEIGLYLTGGYSTHGSGYLIINNVTYYVDIMMSQGVTARVRISAK